MKTVKTEKFTNEKGHEVKREYIGTNENNIVATVTEEKIPKSEKVEDKEVTLKDVYELLEKVFNLLNKKERE